MNTVITDITTQCGQQIWLDNLSRSLIESGELQERIDAGVTGLTSNPSIFHQAITKDPAYKERLEKVKKIVSDPEERFEQLVLPDIQDACDLFRPIYDTNDGKAGFVSFEVSPKCADDSALTIDAIRRVWKAIDRPNAMIKIPATKAGIKAIEVAISEGINVNVTLLFSIAQINAVQTAYLNGIRKRVYGSLPVEQIVSVASLFLSRIDTLTDRLINDPSSPLAGKVAISLAKMAYQNWRIEFLPQVAELDPANPQKLLWASTSTKNPTYSDLLYVENLMGPETVNTLPEATLNALLDHGKAVGRLTDKLIEAEEVLKAFEAKGHDLNAIGEKLQQEGLILFEHAYDQLLELMK